jgi:putative transposase
MRYHWIQSHQRDYPVVVLCRVLRVSTSGYYTWLERKPSLRQEKRQHLADAVFMSYRDSEKRYGYRKIHEDLHEQHIFCCEETVRRVMKAIGIHSCTRRKYVVTTDSDHSYKPAENLLERDFTAEKPNCKWLTDITYVETGEGWLYLAAVLDVFSRKIVGWSMGENIDTELVKSALDMAVRQRKPDIGLLHHSDRGVQYASGDYQQKLKDLDIVCSMSRKGNCWDNAMMESFFGSLKTECVYQQKYKTREQAKQDLFKYIEIFYNRKRRHASLGYISPEEFERRYKLNAENAA